MKKRRLRKTSFTRRDPCNAKTVNFFTNLSLPVDRGHVPGLETQLTASETQWLRNYMIVTANRAIRNFHASTLFSRACSWVTKLFWIKSFGQSSYNYVNLLCLKFQPILKHRLFRSVPQSSILTCNVS